MRAEDRSNQVPPRRHRADAASQFAERALLQEDACDALAHQAARLGIADPCGDHQNAALEAGLPRRRKELRGALRAEVVVEQHQVERLLRQQGERFADAGAVLDVRAPGPLRATADMLSRNNAWSSTSEDADQILLGCVCHHASTEFSTGHNSTVKQLPEVAARTAIRRRASGGSLARCTVPSPNDCAPG